MKNSLYPEPYRPVHTGEASDLLDQVAEMANAVGIKIDVLDDARKLIARARAAAEEVRARHEDTNALTSRIAGALAGGMSLTEAESEITKAQPSAILKRAAARSEEVAIRRAFNETGRELDADRVLEETRGVVADALARIRKLREPLDGIENGEQATEGGAKKAAAWVDYRDQLARFEKAHELVALLRKLGWIEPLPRGLNPTYGRIDLVREDKRRARRARQTLRSLLDERCDRWLAGGPYTEATAKRFRDEMEGEHEAEEQELQAVGDPVARLMRRAAQAEELV